MPSLLLFISYVVSRYIFVELEDQNLCVLNRETGEEINTINIQSIVNENIRVAKPSEMYNEKVVSKHSSVEDVNRSIGDSAVHGDSLRAFSAPKPHIDYCPSRASGEKVDVYGRRRPAGIAKISVWSDLPINSAYVNKRGYICLAHNNLHINTGIFLSEILEKPKIIGGYVFMASKENIMLAVQDVTIFMVKIRVEIVETRAQCRRTINLVYIHSPFSSSCGDIEVVGQAIRLRQPKITRTFDQKIVNIYECKEHEGCVYLSRVYPSSNIVLYHRREKPSSYRSYYYLALVPATLLLFLVLRIRRKIKIARMVYEVKGYKVAEGEFDKNAVMVKIYKRRDRRIHGELKFLSDRRHHCIVRYIYKEYTNKYLYIAFEHTYGLQEATIMDRMKFYKELVDVLFYLHKEGFVYNNLAPANVRVSHSNSPVLINFEDINSERCSVGTVNWRSAEVILNEFGIHKIDKETRHKSDVFSLGLLLYYLEYNEHPFEIADSEENTVETKIHVTVVDDGGQPHHEETLEHDGSTNAQDACCVALDSAMPIAKTRKKSIVYNGQDEFPVSSIEQNILAGKFKLAYVHDQTFYFLITHCVKRNPNERYSIELVRYHPYFWSSHKIFNFLANLSDILENRGADGIMLCKRLERNRYKIFKDTWMDMLDRTIVDNLCSRRIYNPNSVQSLLRAIRNKGRHYKELPEDIKVIYKTFPGGFVKYYMQLFPRLLMVCYISASCIAVEESLAMFYPQGQSKS